MKNSFWATLVAIVCATGVVVADDKAPAAKGDVKFSLVKPENPPEVTPPQVNPPMVVSCDPCMTTVMVAPCQVACPTMCQTTCQTVCQPVCQPACKPVRMHGCKVRTRRCR